MFQSFPENTEFKRLTEALRRGDRIVSLGGLTSVSSKALVLGELWRRTGKRFVIVTGMNTSAEEWRSDLGLFCPKANKAVLPGFETGVYSGLSPHAGTLELRALTLWGLRREPPELLILPIRSLLTRLPSTSEIDGLSLDLAVGNEFDPAALIERIKTSGYVNEDPVTGLGQFSVRGGIVDVWSPSAAAPARIEFFGDVIDSIREFDPDTQLSTGVIEQTSVSPMREYSVSPDDLKQWADAARKRFANETFGRALKDRTDLADAGEHFPGWEFLLPLTRPLSGSVFEHAADAVFVIDEPVEIEEIARNLFEETDAQYRSAVESGQIGLAAEALFLSPDELRAAFDARSLLEFRALGRQAAADDEEIALEASLEGSRTIPIGRSLKRARRPIFLFPTSVRAEEVELISRPTRRFGGRFADFASYVRAIPRGGLVKFVLRTTGLAERLEEVCREYDIPCVSDAIAVGDLSSGFEMPALQIVCFAESDVFGDISDVVARGYDAKPRKTTFSAFVSDFRDLKPGDLVVHIDHGIGRFEGLKSITAQGVEREFILLAYADDAKLFVPVERLDLVSRYSSGETASVALDRLGGLGWQKTKAKAKRAMRDMADELIRLYAERKLVAGHAFSPDAPWQHEFEDAFPYELTPDQAKAIADVKLDMETPQPMDRLIVGDVGYGKTEVAMRAAFKAVMDGKQVAVLSPTTILAYQHFETFKRRFAAFPANVELLSRFRSPKEQKQVIEAAEKGDVDVLIGTHRVLSNDVRLPKLGLVVVDEEQRFGVAHKEKLKHLKKKVDVLTLSATPIPRTLNMSMLGMRDMSIIETPPRDRLSINTQVVQFSESVVRSAIDLELSRSGQVFFIHNRVETIAPIAALVQKIVPNARIAVGHGQMNEKEMEQVMLDFIDYKYDVLVATTIIENGIDIPRANTIIINRADNYGLSQLYQLRGRVGRSNRRAYAYLLIPSELELTPVARRRLSAIREFSDLGAGFRIAALDMELRGTGNLLGGQQSGHLDALGFDLYTKMLERTIAEIRGEAIEDETSVSMNLGIDVSIPFDYIADTSQRLRTYKRIASARSEETLMRIRDELADRYGRLPDPVNDLFAYGKLRRLADMMRIVSIDRAGKKLAVKLGERSRVSPEKLMAMVAENDELKFSPNGILRLPIGDQRPIEAALGILDRIRV